jgi:hypothetical protein
MGLVYNTVVLEMDHSVSGTEPVYSARAEVKRVLLRLAVFFLVLFTTHGLMLWLHPMGAHAFLWMKLRVPGELL